MDSDWNPLTAQLDLTTANSVQSLFTGPKDAWAQHLAEDFVDLVIWNDNIDLPVISLAAAADKHGEIVVPPLVNDLLRREPGLLEPTIQIVPERRELAPQLLEPALDAFSSFCRANPRSVREFYRLHNEGWIRDQVLSRSDKRNHYVYEVEALHGNEKIVKLARAVELPEPALFYLFDLVLKYFLYAERAQGGSYLSHPIRSQQRFSFMLTADYEEAVHLPFRLGPYLVGAGLNQDGFTSQIHEARAFIADLGLAASPSAQPVERDVLRELAARLRLPGRLKGYEKIRSAATVVESSAGIAGSFATGHYMPAVAGSILSIATTVWSGSLPGAFSRFSWLRWMVEWPLEDVPERLELPYE